MGPVGPVGPLSDGMGLDGKETGRTWDADEMESGQLEGNPEDHKGTAGTTIVTKMILPGSNNVGIA